MDINRASCLVTSGYEINDEETVGTEGRVNPPALVIRKGSVLASPILVLAGEREMRGWMAGMPGTAFQAEEMI